MPIAAFLSGVTAHASREFAHDKLHVWLDCPGKPGFSMNADQLFTSVERRTATASGFATRLENLYTGLPDTRAQLVADIAHYQREVDVNAPRIDAVFARAEELQTKQVRLRQLRMEIEQAQQSEEAVAARQAAQDRMRRAGRGPGWSLELNPTTAMVEEAGVDSAADYVMAVKRTHRREAEIYRADHPEPGAPGLGSLLGDTRSATPRPRQAPPTVQGPGRDTDGPERGRDTEPDPW